MGFDRKEWNSEDVLRQLRRETQTVVWIAVGIVVLGLLGWAAATGYYTVEPNEQAVLLRFGRAVDVRGPGLHLKLPFGLDTTRKVEVTEKKREEFGFRTREAGVETVYEKDASGLREEARMLTGDLNILNIQWIVRYQVEEIRDYFFNVRKPVEAVRDTSEAVMRMVVGNSSVDEALTIGRGRIQTTAREMIQDRLDAYDSGIRVVAVRLKDVSPPEDVKEAFNEVNRARQQKETIINEAKAEVNSKVPEATGKKERVVDEARGYAKQRVNEARGDVARFGALLEKYSLAPEVTARRIYIETMSEQLQKVEKKYIMDSSASQVLKFLDLKESGGVEGGRR
ncbi:MAG: FtsH protease activity modulator HflK [Candidatus Brocadiia bacterium]